MSFFFISLFLQYLLIHFRLAGDAPQGWRTGYVLALFIVGIFLLVAFVYWQSIAKNALMPLWVWKDRNFSLVRVIGCFIP